MAYRFSKKFNQTKGNYEVSLSLIIFKEDNAVIAFCPTLDLSGYGDSQTEAIKSFEFALEEFLRYTTNKKTINKVLSRLGWKQNIKQKTFSPPVLSDLLNKKYMANIINNNDFTKKQYSVLMPAV